MLVLCMYTRVLYRILGQEGKGGPVKLGHASLEASSPPEKFLVLTCFEVVLKQTLRFQELTLQVFAPPPPPSCNKCQLHSMYTVCGCHHVLSFPVGLMFVGSWLKLLQ